MTKTAIREVPRELPHARIFLDDLFEVETILRESYAKLPNASPIGFEYTIDGRIKLTTHEELKEHEGYSSNFYLYVVGNSRYFGSSTVLSISRFSNPEFTPPYDLKDQNWEIFGKVAEVFKTREDKFKNAIMSLPFWLSWMLLPAMVACAILANLKAVTQYVDPRAFYSAQLLLLIGYLVAFYEVFRRNRIYFRYARQDQKARDAARRERFEKFLWLLAGTILGALATVLVSGHIRK
ncbi:MAG: hypothetical protein WCE63_08410 [Acidobacteriaceae bacterium]